jgi:hypothetical protein
MKAIKTILFLFLIFSIFQCNKDAKIDPIENILPNGNYGFKYTSQFGVPVYFNYDIIDNNLYVRINDTFCYERIAGHVYKDKNGFIKLSKLHIQGHSSLYPCAFSNDKFFGDTEVIVFNNIISKTDIHGNIELKGDCNIIMPSGLPFERLYGPFNFGFHKFQLPK